MSDIATALTGSVPTDGSAPMTGQLRLIDGSVGTPGISFATETTSGLYRIGVGDFGFSIAGVKLLEIKNTTTTLTVTGIAAGNVAILGGVTIATAGNVTINAPTSGVNLATFLAGTGDILTARNSGNSFQLSFGSTAAVAYIDASNATNGFALTTQGSANVRLAISNNGNTTLNEPSAGATLAIRRTGDGDCIVFTRTGVQTMQMGFGDAFLAGQAELFSVGVVPLGLGTTGAAPIHFYANGTLLATMTNGGGVQIGAPTGGDQGLGTLNATGLFVNGVAGAPQNSQSAAYQLVLADAGRSIYHPSADVTARIWTIPANVTVAFPIGTMVGFDNDTGAGIITIAITTDTLVFAPSGGTGSRALAAGGQATARKVTATRWMISGVGLT